MPIEDRTPPAIVPHLMTDDHHSHGILLLLPVSLRRRRSSLVVSRFILPADLARRGDQLQACWHRAYRDFSRTLLGTKRQGEIGTEGLVVR
jgi:hypothetical protein